MVAALQRSTVTPMVVAMQRASRDDEVKIRNMTMISAMKQQQVMFTVRMNAIQHKRTLRVVLACCSMSGLDGVNVASLPIRSKNVRKLSCKPIPLSK
jgi:hypothetical protein